MLLEDKFDKKYPKKYLNSSARNIKNKKKAKFFEKFILNYDELNLNKTQKLLLLFLIRI